MTAIKFPPSCNDQYQKVYGVATTDDGNLVDKDNPLQTQKVAGSNDNFDLEIGKGNLTGYAFIFIAASYGAVSVAGNIVGTSGVNDYPFITTATTITVESDEANDTELGTGAQVVALTGLDEDYIEFVELVTMDGTNPVTTTQEYWRINGVNVIQVGSSMTNEGIITVLNGADNLGMVDSEHGVLNSSVRTVPAGRTWFPSNYLPSCGQNDEIRVEATAIVNGVKVVFSDTYVYETNLNLQNVNRLPFPEKSDVWLKAFKEGVAASGKISTILEWYEINNDNF